MTSISIINILMIFIVIFIPLLIGYLIGSIPFGYLLVKVIHKEDIRKFGSGNIGATNIWRRGFKILSITTFLLDAGKALIAMYIFQIILYGVNNITFGLPVKEFNLIKIIDIGSDIDATLRYTLASCTTQIVGFFAIIGHIYSIFLKGKGGKGVSTFIGYLLYMNPILIYV